jgi:putative membrane protein
MPLLEAVAGRTIAAVAARIASRRLDLRVEGVEHVPAVGPVLIVARHYHHLYDGVALLAALPRRLHVVVALDWARTRVERAVMEWAVETARWPALLRDDALARISAGGSASAYRPDESQRYRLRAIRTAVDLLVEGAAVVVFPEGYPNVDPRWSPKTGPDAMLPFRPGCATIWRLATKRAGTAVPVVPAGLAYTAGARWRATLRFGAALPLDGMGASFLRLAEHSVAALSGMDVTECARADHAPLRPSSARSARR